MGRPACRVLSGQQPAKALGNLPPDNVEFFGRDPKRHSPAEIHDAADAGARRRSPGHGFQDLPQFVLSGWRDSVEEGQVRRHLVPFGGIMVAAQGIEPGEVFRRKFGSDD